MKKALIAIIMAWPIIVLAQPDDPPSQDAKLDQLEQRVANLELMEGNLKEMIELEIGKATNSLKTEIQAANSTQNSRINELLVAAIALLIVGGGNFFYARNSLNKLQKKILPDALESQKKEVENALKTSREEAEQLLANSQATLKQTINERQESFEADVRRSLKKKGKDVETELKQAEERMLLEGKTKLENIATTQFEVLFKEGKQNFREMLDFHDIDAKLKNDRKILLVYQDRDTEIGQQHAAEGLKLLRETFQFGKVEPHPASKELTYKEMEAWDIIVFYDIHESFEDREVNRWFSEVKIEFSGQKAMNPSFSFLIYSKKRGIDFLDKYRSIGNAANSKFTLYARMMESLRFLHLDEKYSKN